MLIDSFVSSTVLALPCDTWSVQNYSNNNVPISFSGRVSLSSTEKYYYSSSVWFISRKTSYLSSPANSNFDFSSTDFTLECQVKFTQLPSTADDFIRLFSFGVDGAASSLVFGLKKASSAGFILFCGSTAVGSTSLSSTVIQLDTTSWRHFAVSVSGTSGKLYFEGANITDTSTITLPAAGAVAFNFGADPTCSSSSQFGFAGFVQDIRATRAARYTGNYFDLGSIKKETTFDSFSPLVQSNIPFSSVSLFNDVDNSHKADYNSWMGYPRARGSKFYSSCLEVNATATYGCYWTPSADFAFGTGDFTLEMWVRVPPGLSWSGSNFVFYSSRATTSSAANLWFGLTSGNLYWVSASNTTSVPTIPFGLWVHLAMSRVSSTMYVFCNGTLVFNSFADSNNHTDTACYLGAEQSFNTTSCKATYFQDFRITKGVGRYTNNFTPPGPLKDSASWDPYYSSVVLLCPFDGDARDYSIYNRTMLYPAGSSFSFVSNSGRSTGAPGGVGFRGAEAIVLRKDVCTRISPNQVEPLTFECWVYPFTLTASTWFVLLSKKQSSSVNYSFSFGFIGNSLNFRYSINGTTVTTVACSSSISINTWYHVAFVYAYPYVRMYINGVLDAAITLSSPIWTLGEEQFLIGVGQSASTPTYADYLDAEVSDLRITRAEKYTDPGRPYLSVVAGTLNSQLSILSLAVFNNKLYAGTGPNGRLFEWNGVDAWVQVAGSLNSQTEIRSLVVFNNKLYGGTGQTARLFEWNGVDAWVQVAGAAPSQVRVFSLAVYNGKLYGGTDPSGSLYEWNGVDAWVQVAGALNSQPYLWSLAVYNGKLYGGTGTGGRLFEWNGSNAWVEVAGALNSQTYILSLAVYNGKLYGGTYPNGRLFEWNGSNAWVEVAGALNSQESICSLAVLDGKLYGGTAQGAKIFMWNGSNAWVELSSISTETEIRSLVAFNGKIYGGTVSNGKLVELTPRSSSADFTPERQSSGMISGYNRSILSNSKRFFDDGYWNSTELLMPLADSAKVFTDFSKNALALRSTEVTSEYETNQKFYSYTTRFSGAGSYLTAANQKHLIFSLDDFTLEFWLNSTVDWSTQSSAGIIGQTTDASSGWSIYRDTTSGAICLRIGSVTFPANSICSQSTWQHWSVVRRGATVTWYLNGVADKVYSTGGDVDITDSSGIFYVGYNSVSTTSFTGCIQDLRITRAARYTAAFSAPTALLAHSLTEYKADYTSPLPIVLLSCYGTNNGTALMGNAYRSPVTYATFSGNAKTSTDQSKFYGASLNLDGTNSYLTLSAAQVNLYGIPFTIDLWVYPTAAKAQTLVGYNTVASDFWSLDLDADNTVWFRPNGGGQTIHTSATVSINTWNHLAVTYDGVDMRVFINGAVAGTITTSTGISTANGNYNLVIGANLYSPASGFYSGYMQDVRIVPGFVVFPSSGFTPPTAGVIDISTTQSKYYALKPETYSKQVSLALPMCGNDGDSMFYSASEANCPPIISRVGNARLKSNIIRDYKTSAYFDGGSGLTLTSVIPLAPLATSPFTIEMWVLPKILDSKDQCLYHTGSSTALYFRASDSTFIWYQSSGVRLQSKAVDINKWHHIAIVRDSSSVNYMYLNGQRISTTYTNTATQVATTAYIGHNNSYAPEFFTGFIQDLRVTLAARYTANFIPPEPILTDQKRKVLAINPYSENVYSTYPDLDTGYFEFTGIESAKTKIVLIDDQLCDDIVDNVLTVPY